MLTLPVDVSVRAARRGLRVTIVGVLSVVAWTILARNGYLSIALAVSFVAIGIFLLRPALGMHEADLFGPACLFPACYCLWFGLGSMDFLPASLQFSFFEPIPLRMWGYYVVGLAGYFLAIRFRSSDRPLRHERLRLSKTWNSHRFATAMMTLTLVGVGAYAYLVYRGGIPILSDNLAESRVEIGVKNGVAFTTFLSALWTVIPMLFVFHWSKPRRKLVSALTYSFSTVLGLMLLSMGSRGYVFIPALAVIIIRHYLVGKWRMIPLLLIGVFLFALIGIAGYLRDYSEGTALIDMGFPSWLQPLAPAYLYVRAPIATFRDISEIINAQGKFQHGALFLSPFAVLAPGHHLSSDLFFKAILRDQFLGFGEPATLLGVFYADFGVPGVLAGMLGTGLLARYLYRQLDRQATPISVLLFSYYSYLLLFSLFGSLFPYLSTLWVPFMFVVVDRFARQQAPIANGAGLSYA